MTRLHFIYLAFALTLFGVISIVAANTAIFYTYVSFSTALFLLIGIGGIKHYNSQTQRDMRDIYRERIKMLNENIESLREENIELVKENTKLKRLDEERSKTKEKRSDTGKRANVLIDSH